MKLFTCVGIWPRMIPFHLQKTNPAHKCCALLHFKWSSTYQCNMSTKPKILISHTEIPVSALDILKDKYELIFSPGIPRPTRQQLLKDAKGVVGILWYSKERIDKEFVEAAGDQLKVVACCTAGYDHVDVPLLKSLNIKASNTPGVLNNACAEIAIGLLLSTSRNLLKGYKAILSNQWDTVRPAWMWGHGLDNSTVGIIGLGGIGFTIAKRVQAFEVKKILYSGRSEKKAGKEIGAIFVPLDTLLRESDFVIIACALNNETKHLMNKEAFQKMKPTSILINISRGDIVNQDDLVEALQNNVIWGAGLDVMTPEPLPPDHPLTKLPNCVLSPHLGTQTDAVTWKMAELTARNIYNALNDIPLLTPVW
uniref:Glyoxylate reductase/hydroxypyruvate reductase n=2 Tax=Cuerna arida TaxID=1464854 RepID=A0A1B6GR01_9HEMI